MTTPAGTLAAQKEAFAAALESAPAQGTTPAALIEQTGLSRGWVQQTLAMLHERGAVTCPARGYYAPVPGASIPDALAEIKAESGALLARLRARLQEGSS